MALSTGIVGLPNVGKSTLFNTITNSQVEAANYPFATIEPNVGIVHLNDIRLKKLAEIVKPDKVVPATFKFVDIAGLVAGASKGEGLGNKFLANIREVDSICHVVRCFTDSNITHVHDKVDPLGDVEIINLELAIADLEIVEKRIQRIIKKGESGDKEAMHEANVLKKLVPYLESGKMIPHDLLVKEEKELIKSMNLITLKPVLYVANISENDVSDPDKNSHYQILKEFAEQHGNLCIPISAKIEHEISTLDEESKVLFMSDLGLNISGLDLIINTSFKLLGLATYFTIGKVEVRAWTFTNGMSAPECAGVIHTDFQKGFIKAEVFHYDDFIEYKSESALKDNGKLRLEGKNYIMKDGDICHFRFNV